jgi:hypothetical protein
VPVLLGDDPGEGPEGLFFDSFSCSPSDVAGLDRLDAAGMLKGMWEASLPSAEEEEYDTRPAVAREHAPFGRRFRGWTCDGTGVPVTTEP